MAQGFHPVDFGERLAAIRRDRGFRTTQDLADAMRGSRITSSVLRNIESGRKVDISVAQLLDLCMALHVPVIALLAPLARLADPVQWPNVSDDVSMQSAYQLDDLLSVTWGPDARGDVYAEALLSLRSLRRREEEIASLEREVLLLKIDPAKSRLQTDNALETAESVLRQVQDERAEILERLAEWGIDGVG